MSDEDSSTAWLHRERPKTFARSDHQR